MKMGGIATARLLFCRNWCFLYDCGRIKHAILPQLIFFVYLRQNKQSIINYEYYWKTVCYRRTESNLSL